MLKNQMIVSPGQGETVIDEYGKKIKPPKGWIFLPAGDAGITRKVTSKGIFWRVQVKKGRRMISKGIWAPEETIREAKELVETTRSTDAYQKKKVYAAKRRDEKQTAYEQEFQEAVEKFLHFHSKYKDLEKLMAEQVTRHAIPIGSGTVARTSMIPIEKRASHAVIAWMRHKTTSYDNMHIPLVKGERREVRKQLAQKSIALLSNYRLGKDVGVNCPLARVIIID
ncbi:MAG: DUF2293 domain-containing protein [Bacteroidales bacterium]|nr:DUF2293 domain-containing protein [Bacteroidales bacterium]